MFSINTEDVWLITLFSLCISVCILQKFVSTTYVSNLSIHCRVSQCWNNMKSAALTSCCCHPWLPFALSHQTRREAEGKGKRQPKSSPWCMYSWAFISCLEQILPYISLSLHHCLPLPRLDHDCLLRTQVIQRLVFFGLILQFLLFPQKSFTTFKIRLRSYMITTVGFR